MTWLDWVKKGFCYQLASSSEVKKDLSLLIIDRDDIKHPLDSCDSADKEKFPVISCPRGKRKFSNHFF